MPTEENPRLWVTLSELYVISTNDKQNQIPKSLWTILYYFKMLVWCNKTVMLKDMKVSQNINATCLNIKRFPPFRKP